MTKSEFWIMANLAILRAEIRTLKCGFLESRETPSLPLRGWVYLWTFTLPGDKSSLDELATCWRAWQINVKRDLPTSYLRGVRVFEPSPTMRWHAHIVTLERMNVQTIRQHAQKYGFGRINVRRIPASKAGYIAKYLLKWKKTDETKGHRLAAVIGTKGVSMSDIQVVDTWHDYILKVTPQPTGMFTPWVMRHAQAVKIWHNSISAGNSAQTKNQKP